jgi:FkbM family methyltransferase
MFSYLKRKITRYQQKRTFQEYGYEVKRFTIPGEGELEYAQWQHPFEGEKVMEAESINFYKLFLQSGDVAIDIGAHTGDTSVPMAFAAGKSGCVLAIEPNQYVFKILEKNASLNPSKTTIIPLNFAVTEQDGTFEFNYSDASFCNGGFLSEIESKNHKHTYTLSVKGRNLASFLHAEYEALLPKLTLVKVDAEGYDKEIIKSIREILTRWQPFLITECYKRLTDIERFDLFEAVTSLGYSLYRIGDLQGHDRIAITRKEDMLKWPHMDMIGVPQGKQLRLIA